VDPACALIQTQNREYTGCDYCCESKIRISRFQRCIWDKSEFNWSSFNRFFYLVSSHPNSARAANSIKKTPGKDSGCSSYQVTTETVVNLSATTSSNKATHAHQCQSTRSRDHIDLKSMRQSTTAGTAKGVVFTTNRWAGITQEPLPI